MKPRDVGIRGRFDSVPRGQMSKTITICKVDFGGRVQYFVRPMGPARRGNDHKWFNELEDALNCVRALVEDRRAIDDHFDGEV